MKETRYDTGTHGRVIVRDRTDTSGKTLEILVQNTTPIEQFVNHSTQWGSNPEDWTGWQGMVFPATTVAQRVFYRKVGYADTFTFNMIAAHPTLGTIEITDDLVGGASAVRIKVNGVYKRAIPFVKEGGVWKPADAYVNDGGTWKKTV